MMNSSNVQIQRYVLLCMDDSLTEPCQRLKDPEGQSCRGPPAGPSPGDTQQVHRVHLPLPAVPLR